MRNTHVVVLCLLSAATAFLCGMQKREVIGSPVYITAAHLNPESLPGYTRIYADRDRDTAYYLKDDFDYYTPSIGEEVTIDSMQYMVTSVKDNVGFYVKCDDAYRGMSGSRVLDTGGNEIGFVSASQPNGELLCISTGGTYVE